MKELSIEEKARAYDEALERARVYWETDDDNTLDIKAKGTMEYLFPELAESEGDRIRKEILEVAETVVSCDGTLYGKKYNCREWIAWLEKQGKQKEYTFKSIPRLLDMIEPSDKTKAYCQKLIDTLTEEGYNTDAKIVKEVLKGWNGEDVPMAVMDEQKPTDNFKSKFKVGDWVVWDNKMSCYVDNIYQGKESLMYTIIDTNNIIRSCSVKVFDDNARLWTIKDAKPGDVLKEDSCIFIIGRMKPDETAIVHCCLFDDGDFDLGSILTFDVDSTYPATKEQRDLLFQKMNEAGYEWDAEKKELKKIEQSKLTEFEDAVKDMMDDYRDAIDANDATTEEVKERAAYMLSLIPHKPADWSEEDERNLNCIMKIIKEKAFADYDVDENNNMLGIYGMLESWLKLLKQRYAWKPSDEQMECLLSEVTAWTKGCPKQKVLESLYNDLKKLKA